MKQIRGPRLVLNDSKRKVKTLPQPCVSRTKSVYIGYTYWNHQRSIPVRNKKHRKRPLNEGLLYSGGLAVLANSEFRLAVTVEFVWQFTVKKPSRSCRKLQLYHAVYGFCVFGGGLSMLQFCRSLSTWSALFVSHPRRWYPLHDPVQEISL